MPIDQSIRAKDADILLSTDIFPPLSPELDSICRAPQVPLAQQYPLYGCHISAGFPSPASDYLEDSLDLNQLMVKHPSSTFFVRVSGDSMIDAGVFEGDYLVIDRSLQVSQNDIVIAVINAELTVKRFFRRGSTIELSPENKDYPSIIIQGDTELLIWGIVIGVVRKTR